MSKVKLASPQPVIEAGVYDVGIDVSHHQGRINWSKVAKAGIQYTWIKATEGVTFRDKNLERNTKGALDAGLQVGWYHYAYPSIKGDNWAYGDGHAEGEKFGETIQGLPGVSLGLPDRFLPFALDYEDDRFLSKATQHQCADWVMGWLDGLELYVDSEYTCIYTNLNIGSTLALLPASYQPRLWQAHYPGPSNDGVRNRQYVLDGWTPQTPEIWTAEDRYCWQYTHAGSVPGIGRCDINVRPKTSPHSLVDNTGPDASRPSGTAIRTIGQIEQDRKNAMNEILVDSLSRDMRALVDRVHVLANQAVNLSNNLYELQDDLEEFFELVQHTPGEPRVVDPSPAEPVVFADGIPPNAPDDMTTLVPASEFYSRPPKPDSEKEREALMSLPHPLDPTQKNGPLLSVVEDPAPAEPATPIADLPMGEHLNRRILPNGQMVYGIPRLIDGEYWFLFEDGSRAPFIMPGNA